MLELEYHRVPFKSEGKFSLQFDLQSFYIWLICSMFLVENIFRIYEVQLESVQNQILVFYAGPVLISFILSWITGLKYYVLIGKSLKNYLEN